LQYKKYSMESTSKKKFVHLAGRSGVRHALSDSKFGVVKA
jgi:hypothetical protein